MEDKGRALRYAEECARMIRIETVQRPGAEADFARLRELITRLFPRVAAACQKWELGGSLLLRWPGRDRRGLLLMSHQDVVEAPGDWRYPPFSGTIAQGRLWGRGALDVKGNLYCILRAVEELLEEGCTPERDVYIASSDREEIGGDERIVDFLRERGIAPELLVDEGSSVQKCPVPGIEEFFAMVAVAEKGYLDVKCIARGRGGHASAPGKGTPLPRLGAFLCEVEERELFPVRLNPASAEMYRRLAALAGDPEQAKTLAAIAEERPGWRELLDERQRELLGTTVAFTMAGGSSAANVIPQEAFVTCNVRIAPGGSVAETMAALGEVAARHGVELEILRANEPSPVTDPGGAAFRAVERAAEAAWPGRRVLPFLLSGGTDTKHFVGLCPNCLRFTALEIDPGQQAAVHGVDENIDVDALPHGVDFFKALIRAR